MEFTTIQWQSDVYDQAVQLRDRVLRSPLGLTFSPEQLAAEKNQLHFGVFVESELAACVVGVPLSETSVKLRQMAVAPNMQKAGIGSFLITQVEQALREQGFQEIEMNARKVAIGFYEKLGYQAVGDEFIEVTVAHFKMVKQIA